MQRFEFSLERVLKVKKQREWLAELKQKQARAGLEAARAEVQALNDRLAQAAVELATRLSGGARSNDWMGRWEQTARHADTMALLEARVHEAIGVYEEASTARTQIAMEVEALLSLRRQHWQEYRLRLQRAEQERLDEVGMRRWRDDRQDDTHSL